MTEGRMFQTLALGYFAQWQRMPELEADRFRFDLWARVHGDGCWPMEDRRACHLALTMIEAETELRRAA